MTTSVHARVGTRPSPLAGFGIIWGLALRRERLPLVLWTVATAASVLSSLGAISSLYPDAASRAGLAATISTNPAFIALNGPLTSTSVGGVTAWRIGVYGGLAVGYLAASTVIRRTRTEEEAGRAEVLASAVLGRRTLLAVALTLAWAAAIGIGVLCAVGCIAQGQPVGGSLALGAALAGPGLVYSAVAAVTAQIFESARAALSAAGLALGVAYALRAIADSQPSAHWLSFASPLGWSQRLAPFGATRWWVLLLFLGSTAALTAAAVRLHAGRDLGLGLFPARLGPRGSRRLRSGGALAARLHRSQLLGWTIGLAVFGALTGSLARTAGSLLSGNAQIQQLMERLGGVGRPSDEMFAVMAGIAGLLAAAYAVAAAMRVRGEETSGRAEWALSTALSRRRLLTGHLAVSLGGSAALLLIAGLASGVVYGAPSGDIAGGMRTGVSATAVQIPAVLVVGGLTAALIGWLPRQAAAGWALLAMFLLLGELGPTLGLPTAVIKLSPFAWIPPLPTGAVSALPLVVLTALAAVTTAAGFAGFLRRDIG